MTGCDVAHEELPRFSKRVRLLHWSVPDPVGDASRLAFDRALERIASRIENLAPRVHPAPCRRQIVIRVGINGFGRMGRLALRAGWNSPEFEVGHINELHGDIEVAAHLLTFDSVHGRWDRDVTADGDASASSTAASVSFGSAPDPANPPWAELGIDVVIESTGKFRTLDALAPYFAAGVRKVVVAAPVKDERALNVVVGVNDDLYDPERHDVVTAASCTTNCLAPVVRVLHDGLGIARGSITTLHDLTNTQTIVDAPHTDLRRARAAGLSLIPTTTGSATAIGLIFPELRGKLDGLAVRVPLLNASLTDCVFDVDRPTTVDEVTGAPGCRRGLAEGDPGIRVTAARVRRLQG